GARGRAAGSRRERRRDLRSAVALVRGDTYPRGWRIHPGAVILWVASGETSGSVGGTAMKMTIEPVSAFSSLDVLVAMDEGLFKAEGLDLTMASRESRDIRSTTEGTLRRPVTNQGTLQERGEAAMFQG